LKNKLLHTPEGVRDIYGTEYTKKLKLEKVVHKTMKLFGYQDIQTPTFEYFDVFSKEIGTTSSKDLYKFSDQEGNTLVLRPDFTPSVARCAAKYGREDQKTLRFCYQGNTFTNTLSFQGKLKEVTQTGVELIGDGSVEADGEMISLVIESLKNTGLKDFQVSIGEADYFRGICEEVGLDLETEIQLRDYISGKNYFGVQEILKTRNITENHKNIILKINDLFGNHQVLEDACKLVSNPRSLQALERLSELYQVLVTYGVESYVSFDLGMLSKYNYYTGVMFRAYTYGVGDAIVKGGRYDDLLGHFGKSSPAIGFMIVIDDLLNAINRQNIDFSVEEASCLVLYNSENFKTSLNFATQIRRNSIATELIPCEQEKLDEIFLENFLHPYIIWFQEESMKVYVKCKKEIITYLEEEFLELIIPGKEGI
jgi:ATP phosphoribosyltransferase regulatory subunit